MGIEKSPYLMHLQCEWESKFYILSLLSWSHLAMYQASLYLKPNLLMWLFTTSKGIKIGLSYQEKWGVKMHRYRESLCRFYDLHCISCSIWFMTPYSLVMVPKPSDAILEVGIWMGNPKYTYLQLPWIKSPLTFLLAPMCAWLLGMVRGWRERDATVDISWDNENVAET